MQPERHGLPGRVIPRLGRHGLAWPVNSPQGVAGRIGMACRGKTRSGLAGLAWLVAARFGTSRPGRRGKARRSSASQREVSHGRMGLSWPGTPRNGAAGLSLHGDSCQGTAGRGRLVLVGRCTSLQVIARLGRHGKVRKVRLVIAALGVAGEEGGAGSGGSGPVPEWQGRRGESSARSRIAGLGSAWPATRGFHVVVRRGWRGTLGVAGKVRLLSAGSDSLGGSGLGIAKNGSARFGRRQKPGARLGLVSLGAAAARPAWSGPVLPGEASRGSAVHGTAGVVRLGGSVRVVAHPGGAGEECHGNAAFGGSRQAWLSRLGQSALGQARIGAAGKAVRGLSRQCMSMLGTAWPAGWVTSRQGSALRVFAGNGSAGKDRLGQAGRRPARNGRAGVARQGTDGRVEQGKVRCAWFGVARHRNARRGRLASQGTDGGVRHVGDRHGRLGAARLGDAWLCMSVLGTAGMVRLGAHVVAGRGRRGMEGGVSLGRRARAGRGSARRFAATGRLAA
jgi:hypothetical protein